VNNLHSYKSWH